VPIFKCRWVQDAKGIIKDKYGFTTVDLEKIGHKEEPFVLEDKVTQVFYVPDTSKKKRKVVLPRKKCVFGIENIMAEQDYDKFDEIPAFDTFTLPKILDRETTPNLRSSHKDVTPAKGKKGKKGKGKTQNKKKSRQQIEIEKPASTTRFGPQTRGGHTQPTPRKRRAAVEQMVELE
jgi:hypothetical protein